MKKAPARFRFVLLFVTLAGGLALYSVTRGAQTPSLADRVAKLKTEINSVAAVAGKAGAVLRVEFVYRGKNEAQQYYLVLRDGAWKIDRVDESERIKTLIPYGSDATGKE